MLRVQNTYCSSLTYLLVGVFDVPSHQIESARVVDIERPERSQARAQDARLVAEIAERIVYERLVLFFGFRSKAHVE
jgi:hypothetical protein